MSAQTQTIRVRIHPGVRTWQVLVIAAAIALSLMLGILIGRSIAPVAPLTAIGSGYVDTGHVPPGGFHAAANS